MGISFSGFLAKTAGVAGLALIAYDAHKAGKYEATRTQKEIKSKGLTDEYLENMKQEKASKIQSDVKDGLFKFWADENVTTFFTHIAGYAAGAGKILLNDIIPLGLATGAILTKGLPSKLFGLGLVGYGAAFLLQELFGIGKTHK